MADIRKFEGQLPQIGDGVYLDPASCIIGDVVIGARSSLWPGVVVRGDVHHIRIGEATNIQDNSVLHNSHDGEFMPGGSPLIIGSNVTVGHKAILHGCVVGDNTLIGINAVVLSGARIGRNCLIGANSLVTEGKEIPDNSMVLGSPAKVVRELTEAQIAGLVESARGYVENFKRFNADFGPQDQIERG